jgi:glycyl-tRNA synthetase beta chain
MMSQQAASKRDFLFELGVEEMPPRALETLSAALSAGIEKGINEAGIARGATRSFATPRRLAVLIRHLDERQPDRQIERRGPPLAQAFDAQGAPTQAAIAFAASCGVEVAQLQTLKTDKGAWLRFAGTEPGALTVALLPSIVTQALASLPIPKRMRWGSNNTEFVRPVHWAVMMFGSDVIPAAVLGLDAGRTTYGHRFHAPKPILLKSPSTYESALRRAKVIADPQLRKKIIREGVSSLAAILAGPGEPPHHAVIDEELLAEVAALVEWPVPIAGRFEERFLSLPREVVISTVQHHQRYFPVESAGGDLTRHFITVSNIQSRDENQVREGNERVVRPRLSDAAFFWEQDKKLSLAQHARTLERVTFQAKLGSYAQKTARVQMLAEAIGSALGAGPSAAAAAALAKADLMTAMVNEFPELQGTMGRYYAQSEGLAPEIAAALEEQYLPRFSADRLPRTKPGQALAIADRIDTLTGIFAIDQKPTGAKDPFGLRRAALGILRIMLDAKLDIDLAQLLAAAAANQPVQRESAAQESYEFVIERLRGMYAERADGVSGEMLDAVLATDSRSPVDIDARLAALRDFLKLADAPNLAAANKRIVNILKKAAIAPGAQVNAELLVEPAERQLSEALARARPALEKLIAQRQYSEALRSLTSLRPAVDAFFDQVMVMDENIERRNNRLTLLAGLRKLFGGVADLARLPG